MPWAGSQRKLTPHDNTRRSSVARQLDNPHTSRLPTFAHAHCCLPERRRQRRRLDACPAAGGSGIQAQTPRRTVRLVVDRPAPIIRSGYGLLESLSTDSLILFCHHTATMLAARACKPTVSSWPSFASRAWSTSRSPLTPLHFIELILAFFVATPCNAAPKGKRWRGAHAAGRQENQAAAALLT